jgi:hypothetical protein
MWKRDAVRLITFLAGLFYLLEYVLPAFRGGRATVLTEWSIPLGDFLGVVGAFSLGLGWYNLVSAQGRTLRRGNADSLNSLGFFAALLLTLVFGFWSRSSGAKPDWVPRVWDLIFLHTFTPLVASVLSLLAFYIVSASYRAFRIRSVEASLMMAAAVIVMLGQVPLGGWITHALPWEQAQIPYWSQWLMTTITSPALRAIGFGAAVGALAMALRLWLSLEEGPFFGET